MIKHYRNPLGLDKTGEMGGTYFNPWRINTSRTTDSHLVR